MADAQCQGPETQTLSCQSQVQFQLWQCRNSLSGARGGCALRPAPDRAPDGTLNRDGECVQRIGIGPCGMTPHLSRAARVSSDVIASSSSGKSAAGAPAAGAPPVAPPAVGAPRAAPRGLFITRASCRAVRSYSARSEAGSKAGGAQSCAMFGGSRAKPARLRHRAAAEVGSRARRGRLRPQQPRMAR